MSNKCTCRKIIPFNTCNYCEQKFWKYIDERDIEVIRIKEKNVKENKCNCIYLKKFCLYFCDSCDHELNIWIYNR